MNTLKDAFQNAKNLSAREKNAMAKNFKRHIKNDCILIGSELKNFNNSSSMIIFNPDESKILSILSSTKDFDTSKCERLFFLHDNISSLSNQNINNIIIKSPLLDFRLDFYVQADNNTWYVQNNAVNE